MITIEKIKQIVEKKSYINDLSTSRRHRHIVDARVVAFKLTKELCNSVSFASIGKEYNKSHATVMHCINLFEALKNQPSFKRNKTLYNNCLKYLLKISPEDSYLELKEAQSIEELKESYEKKILNLTENYEDIINEKNKTLNLINNNKIIQKISELDERSYKDLETRINAFLRMNSNNKY